MPKPALVNAPPRFSVELLADNIPVFVQAWLTIRRAPPLIALAVALFVKLLTDNSRSRPEMSAEISPLLTRVLSDPKIEP